MKQLPKYFTILTSDNPVYDAPAAKRQISLNTILKCLNIRGMTIIKGQYNGKKETSYLVEHPTSYSAALERVLEQIARDYGQESVTHHENGLNTVSYVNGPRRGEWVVGAGVVYHAEPPQDNYSVLDGQVFTLNL